MKQILCHRSWAGAAVKKCAAIGGAIAVISLGGIGTAFADPTYPTPPPSPPDMQLPQPQIPQAPQVPQVPELPQAPQAPQAPQVPQEPVSPPQAPEQVPQVPEALPPVPPAQPPQPQVPEAPQAPEVPQAPEAPQAPQVPQEPVSPPQAPEQQLPPQAPEAPQAPEQRTGDREGYKPPQIPDNSNVPVPLPEPPRNQGFPEWGDNPPHKCYNECHYPVRVEEHNPLPGWKHDKDRDRDKGHDHDHKLPPPVVPDVKWRDTWKDRGDHKRPPQDPDIFIKGGDHNQVVIVNNITNNTVINNTVINANHSDIYLTNFSTGKTLYYPHIPYKRPWGMPHGWCGGHGGDWGWSAGAGGHYVGGGVFSVDKGCGYRPHHRPKAPLVIYYQNHQTYITQNYYLPQGCGCVYANNTYFYVEQQPEWVTLPGQPQKQYVAKPYAWSPNVITQAPQQGAPPYIYDTGRSESWWSQYWLWVVVIVAGAGAAACGVGAWQYWNRHQGVPPDAAV